MELFNLLVKMRAKIFLCARVWNYKNQYSSIVPNSSRTIRTIRTIEEPELLELLELLEP